jgi:acyl-CoA thioester hydrolase
MEPVPGKRIFSWHFEVTHDLLDGYGHVNNARYLELYERARWAILDEAGLGKDYMEISKTGPVILEVTVRFSRELVPGQKIEIRSQSTVYNNLVFHIEQEMLDDKGKVCSRALFKSSLFDLEKRKIVKADEQWIKAFGADV